MPALLIVLVGLVADGISPVTAAPLVFNRDIKPLLTDNCYACHGPDPGSRKAGLRLDTQAGLFEPTAKRGPTLVAGHPETSELWKRLESTDPDEVMPPPKSGKHLKPEERERIRRWISEGAPWQPHWSFIAPQRPSVPSPANARDAAWIRNPIDALVLARLRQQGLEPAPEADRRALARRLSLDLTGLPPTPEDVEAFAADARPATDAAYVRRLLQSPRWGEHRARYWLDAARYADTHGLHFDNYREMWPYRDWVIRAFNRNAPFDQFTVEQIAGDLLTDPTDEQLIATGFHRCNATTNEGGTIEEENQVNYANDRVTTTSWVWLGLTANCCACHDHKFDPLTLRDFYSMAALFRNTTQSGFDGNVKDGGNASLTVIENPTDRARWLALPEEIQLAKTNIDQRRRDAEGPFNSWAGALTLTKVQEQLRRDLAAEVPLRETKGTTFGASFAGQSVQVEADGPVSWKAEGSRGPALHFEKDGSVNLGGQGDFDLGQPFSYGAWVFVPTAYNESASIVARMEVSQKHRGWDLWIQQGQFAAHFVNQWPENALKVKTKKRLARKGEWQHVFVTFDGTGKAEGVRLYVDGVAAETETEGGSRVRDTLRTGAALRLGRRSEGSGFTGGAIQDFRLYARVLPAPEVKALAHEADLPGVFSIPVAEWKPEVRQDFLDYFLLDHPPFQGARAQLAALEREREGLRLRYPVTHIQREKKDSAPMASILARGQYDKPTTKVPGGVPAVLHPFPANAPTNRLGLARWLVDRQNPLTARVTVNRFWQEVFGTGLVRTTEDFGIMGEAPSHPELLDWLAVEFVESGWDVKHLFDLMVNSSTYRQSAVATPEKLEKDPTNRLLARGPRFRMDAEMVRDSALAAAGLLDPAVGGPSVRTYQPSGVWEAVAMPESNTREYQRDRGAALYRRSLYTFWKRSAPPALMDVFNAPSRETCTVRRERTNTPLQALATLNDVPFVEAARVAAQRVLQDRTQPTTPVVDTLGRRILGRPLADEERRELTALHVSGRTYYASHPEDVSRLLSQGESPVDASLAPAELAALTVVANQLLNLDEVLTK